MMTGAEVKSALMTITILSAVIAFVWWKWKDDLIFQYNLIKSKLLPTPANDQALLEQAFAPKQSFSTAFGNLFRSPINYTQPDPTDYYNNRKFWRQEDDEQ